MDELKITDENYEMYKELYNSRRILKVPKKDLKKFIKINTILIPIAIFIIIIAILKFQNIFMFIYTPTFLLVPTVNFVMLNNIYKKQKENIKTKYPKLKLNVSITELINALEKYEKLEKNKEKVKKEEKVEKAQMTPIMPKKIDNLVEQDKNKLKSKRIYK